MGQFPFLQLGWVWAFLVLRGLRLGLSSTGPPSPRQWGPPIGHSCPLGVLDGARSLFWELLALDGPSIALVLHWLPYS